MKVTVRPSSDLRCAFCHGALAEDARPCRGCFTALHDECWDDARVCPTLGCATWVRLIRIIPRRVLASRWLLAAWLLAFASVACLYLAAMPVFAKLFTETGFSLPWLTEVLFALSSFASTTSGHMLLGAVPVASIALFVRYRPTRWLRPALYSLILLAGALVILTAYALFLPLGGGLCQKL